MRNSSTPDATEAIGRDKGIGELLASFCKSKDDLAEFTPHIFGEVSYGVTSLRVE